MRTRSDAYLERTIRRCEAVLDGLGAWSVGGFYTDRWYEREKRARRVWERRSRCHLEQWRRRGWVTL